MAVTQGFLDQWDRLLIMAGELCTCKEGGECKSCKAKYELDTISYQVSSFLETVE